MELIVAVILVTAGDAEQDLFEEGSRFGRHHRVLAARNPKYFCQVPSQGCGMLPG